MSRLGVCILVLPVLAAGLSFAAKPPPDAGHPSALFAAAVGHAREGAVSQALTNLRASFAAGYDRPADALREPQLEILRQNPESRNQLRDLLHEFARQWQVTIVTPDEPGEPLIVTGTIRNDAGEPISDALVYVYHTDSHGIYSMEGNANPRLFAFMRTDAKGRYEYRTIRPARYPNSNVEQHVHYQVSAAGYEDTNARLGFSDDPRWQKRSAVPAWVSPISRNKEGIDWCVRDIILETQPGADRSGPPGPGESPRGIDFESQIRPIIDPRCAPCHFAGGTMYGELPFDRPETIRKLGTKLFTRIKDEDEQTLIRAYLRQLGDD